MSEEIKQTGDQQVKFQTRHGAILCGTVIRLSRHGATFQVYGIEDSIRASETLDEFTIHSGQQAIYTGRAVVQGVASTGTASIVSALLDDLGFDRASTEGPRRNGVLAERFDRFMSGWGAAWSVRPEFKVAVADIETYLIDLRRWMEQIEPGMEKPAGADLAKEGRDVVTKLAPKVLPILDELFAKYEAVAAKLGEAEIPSHRAYVQRHLHPIVLCAPFAYRSWLKPLGYAGDYETVNMMLRDPQEGGSLFAKLFNVWLLQQGSAAAHRNRIAFITRRLLEETAAGVRGGRKLRVLNLGCGPAREIQNFLEQSELSNHMEATLLDFNDETLEYVSHALSRSQEEHRRVASFQFVKKSVQQLLKEALRTEVPGSGGIYDFVYCGGLFDYLSDQTCSKLLGMFYRLLSPGGLILATNVAPCTPNRGSLELILDWHILYRDAARCAALCPGFIPREEIRVYSDETFVNVMLELRKNDER